jgi:hypothetical protein
MTPQGESTRQNGQHDEQDGVMRLLKKYDLPITRENYIKLAFMGDPPVPWTLEDEANLPARLQDRSKVAQEA